MIFTIILILSSVIVSILGIVFTIYLRENLGTSLIFLLIISIYLFVGIINPLTMFLTMNKYLFPSHSLHIWRISLIFRIIAVWTAVFVQNLILRYQKIEKIVVFLLSFLGGLMGSAIFLPNSFQVITQGPNLRFIIDNQFIWTVFLVFDILSIISIWNVQIRNLPNIRQKELGNQFNLIMFAVSLVILSHGLFILTQFLVFFYLHIFLYIIAASLVLIAVLKRPGLFIVLTNKLYDFIVFHKSGILIFSYNFATGEEKEESVIKGTILIGINHILSHLNEKKKFLRLIKMPERDILLDYNGELGYAVLLVTDSANNLNKKYMDAFMQDFSQTNREKISNMNGLIDISAFKDTLSILKKHFKPYLPKDKTPEM